MFVLLVPYCYRLDKIVSFLDALSNLSILLSNIFPVSAVVYGYIVIFPKGVHSYFPATFQSHKYMNYFTSEQALADFAVLIVSMKKTLPGATNSSVVSFGGSYGGMLSAWLRIKYPNVVVG